MTARAEDPLPPEAGRLPTGRLARTARVGGLVTGQGLRWAGMTAANRMRSPERAEEARDERTAALVGELVDQLSRMRGAAMKVGQLLSMIEFDGLREEQRTELEAKLATLRDDVPPVPFAKLERLMCSELEAPLASVFPMLARKPTFWLLAFGASASSLCGYGLALWTPSIMMRSFGLDLVSAGNFLASLVILGGCAGVFAGGWFADRLGGGDRRWYAWLPAIAWLITAPTFVAGYFAPNLWLAWLLLLIPNALNILWLGPIVTAVQHLVPASMRATASASFLLINNLIGLGIGPWLIGRISDGLKESHGVDALRYAASSCCAFYLLAALLVLFASRSLRADWVEDHS